MGVRRGPGDLDTPSFRCHRREQSRLVPGRDEARLPVRIGRGHPDIYEITVGVPGSERPFLEQVGVQQPEDLSKDGRNLAYVNQAQSGLWNIWLLPLQAGGRASPWLSSRFFNETSPRFSPDGRWIAFDCGVTPEILARPRELIPGRQTTTLEPELRINNSIEKLAAQSATVGIGSHSAASSVSAGRRK